MPKVKIDEQKKYSFACNLSVRVSDLNYGAHLGYDRILGMAHQARVEFMASLNASETDLGDGKTGIVATDLAVVYQGEAFGGDLLEFSMLPLEVGPIAFRLAHKVLNKKTQKPVALIEIGFAAFDYEKRTLARMPDSFCAALRAMTA